MITCFIGFGSNLGDRNYYIRAAAQRIALIPSTRMLKLSTLIETRPCGGGPQGNYLNGVGAIETTLSPYALLTALQEIERSLGRVRTVKNAPRTIDLDILLYGDFCMNEDALEIPHPRMASRDFVLIPFKEIAPHQAERFLSSARQRL